jgi:predicted lipoprotein with Yx(FWY)xxD motif
MTFLKMAAAAALLALVPTTVLAQAAAPTAAECDAWFVKVDTNKDGSLGQQEEVTKYTDMISKSSASSDNSSANATATIMQKDAFLAECAKGTFGMPTTP